MGTVHGSPLWRKPASPLDFAPPRPKSVQFHEVIWTTTCGPGVAESCYAGQQYGSPMPLLRFSEGIPLAFSLKMIIKPKYVKIIASGQSEGDKFTGLLRRRPWRSTCYSLSWRVYFWGVPIQPGANITARQWRELDWAKLRKVMLSRCWGRRNPNRNSVMERKSIIMPMERAAA